MKGIKFSGLFFVFLLLSACTSIPKQDSAGEVNHILREHGVEPQVSEPSNSKEKLESLISENISLNDSIQIALINNAKLNQTYASLGIAKADMYETMRIRNPVFSFSQLNSNQSGEKDLVTLGLITSLSDLITRPSRKALAEAQFAAMKKSMAVDILSILNQVQSSFYMHAAALQVEALKQKQYETARLAAQLSERYHQAGNFSARENLEIKSKASTAFFEYFDAKSKALSSRKDLANKLGLNIADSWKINSQLAIPSVSKTDVKDFQNTAMQSRLDLIVARSKADALAKKLGIVNWTRHLSDIDIGIEREREPDGAKLTGPSLEWEIPLFSRNTEKLRLSGEFKQSILEVQKMTLAIQNEVHANYLKTIGAQELIHEYQHNFIPIQTAIVSSTQKEENFMLIGTFDLLETKQQEYESYVGYIKALQVYWTAYSDLMYAAGDSLHIPISDEKEVFNIEDYLISKQPVNDHAHMHQ